MEMRLIKILPRLHLQPGYQKSHIGASIISPSTGGYAGMTCYPLIINRAKPRFDPSALFTQGRLAENGLGPAAAAGNDYAAQMDLPAAGEGFQEILQPKTF
jgi:hypothetical protein